MRTVRAIFRNTNMDFDILSWLSGYIRKYFCFVAVEELLKQRRGVFEECGIERIVERRGEALCVLRLWTLELWVIYSIVVFCQHLVCF